MSRAEREGVASLRRSADVDDLTDLGSRSFFRRAATRRIELSKNNDLPLSCAVVDVDDFKPYNDLYGHKAGDEALRCVARVLRESSRADDLTARYGGEEFTLLLSRAVEDAADVAELVRGAVERECAPEREASLYRQITVSLGIASLTEDTRTLEQLIEAADKEMYRAKRAGKNRVSVLGTPLAPAWSQLNTLAARLRTIARKATRRVGSEEYGEKAEKLLRRIGLRRSDF